MNKLVLLEHNICSNKSLFSRYKAWKWRQKSEWIMEVNRDLSSKANFRATQRDAVWWGNLQMAFERQQLNKNCFVRQQDEPLVSVACLCTLESIPWAHHLSSSLFIGKVTVHSDALSDFASLGSFNLTRKQTNSQSGQIHVKTYTGDGLTRIVSKGRSTVSLEVARRSICVVALPLDRFQKSNSLHKSNRNWIRFKSRSSQRVVPVPVSVVFLSVRDLDTPSSVEVARENGTNVNETNTFNLAKQANIFFLVSIWWLWFEMKRAKLARLIRAQMISNWFLASSWSRAIYARRWHKTRPKLVKIARSSTRAANSRQVNQDEPLEAKHSSISFKPPTIIVFKLLI